jgi:hypothetical protein
LKVALRRREGRRSQPDASTGPFSGMLRRFMLESGNDCDRLLILVKVRWRWRVQGAPKTWDEERA